MRNQEVLVVVGAGGIGQAIARRQGPGKAVLLADFNDETLESAADALKAAGHAVTTQSVDVSSRESVVSLAKAAEALGSVAQVVMAAGLSPAMAPPAAILKVDLFGTALVLEEFGRVIAPGGAAVVISSMAGHRQPALEPEHERALAVTPTDELLELPFLTDEAIPDSVRAYEFSKRACPFGRLQAGRHTTGSAKTRRSLAARPEGRSGRWRWPRQSRCTCPRTTRSASGTASGCPGQEHRNSASANAPIS